MAAGVDSGVRNGSQEAGGRADDRRRVSEGPAAAEFFGILPKPTHDPAVPTLEKVLGFGWGEEITDPDQVLKYADALAKGAPARVRLLEYARSMEGRPLVLLIVGSPANMDGGTTSRRVLHASATPAPSRRRRPRSSSGTCPRSCGFSARFTATRRREATPGLALAYHLAAGSGPEIETILGGAIVVIDPMENPDGRARFVGSTRRGARTSPRPGACERRACSGLAGWPLLARAVRPQPRLVRADAPRERRAGQRDAALPPDGGGRPARDGSGGGLLLRPTRRAPAPAAVR